MTDHTPEETIEEITLSKEIVTAEQERFIIQEKMMNKYMVAVFLVLLVALSTYLFLSAAQLTALPGCFTKRSLFILLDAAW